MLAGGAPRLGAIDADLQSGSAAAPASTGNGRRIVVVSFKADGTLYWDRERLGNAGELEARALRALGENPQLAVYVQGDRAAAYGISLQVKDALRRGGFRSIGELLERSAEPGG